MARHEEPLFDPRDYVRGSSAAINSVVFWPCMLCGAVVMEMGDEEGLNRRRHEEWHRA